jgi:hypothetical protein
MITERKYISLVTFLKLKHCFQVVLVDQGSLRGSRRVKLSTRSTVGGKCISASSSQGALLYRDTLKTTLQKSQHNN